MHLMECCRSPKHVAEVRALQSQLHCVEERNSSGDRTSSVHVGKIRFCFQRKFLGSNPRGRPPVDSEQEIGSYFRSVSSGPGADSTFGGKHLIKRFTLHRPTEVCSSTSHVDNLAKCWRAGKSLRAAKTSAQCLQSRGSASLASTTRTPSSSVTANRVSSGLTRAQARRLLLFFAMISFSSCAKGRLPTSFSALVSVRSCKAGDNAGEGIKIGTLETWDRNTCRQVPMPHSIAFEVRMS